jgi:beta-galactosidase
MKNPDSAVSEEPFPGFLTRLAGRTVEEADVFSFVPGCTVSVKLANGIVVPARGVAEILAPLAATAVLAAYSGRYYTGKAAVTLNHFGKGACLSLGTIVDADGFREILFPVLPEAALVGRALPAGVEAASRSSPTGVRFRFYLNHGPVAARIELFAPGVDLLSGRRLTTDLLPGAPLRARGHSRAQRGSSPASQQYWRAGRLS